VFESGTASQEAKFETERRALVQARDLAVAQAEDLRVQRDRSNAALQASATSTYTAFLTEHIARLMAANAAASKQANESEVRYRSRRSATAAAVRVSMLIDSDLTLSSTDETASKLC
jgi:hypothetical protein